MECAAAVPSRQPSEARVDPAPGAALDGQLQRVLEADEICGELIAILRRRERELEDCQLRLRAAAADLKARLSAGSAEGRSAVPAAAREDPPPAAAPELAPEPADEPEDCQQRLRDAVAAVDAVLSADAAQGPSTVLDPSQDELPPAAPPPTASGSAEEPADCRLRPRAAAAAAAPRAGRLSSVLGIDEDETSPAAASAQDGPEFARAQAPGLAAEPKACQAHPRATAARVGEEPPPAAAPAPAPGPAADPELPKPSPTAIPPSSLAACPPGSLPACQFLLDGIRGNVSVGRPVGLPNRCSDCFWLSTMQCLRHTPGFPRAVSSGPAKTSQPASNLTEAVAGLLEAMTASEPTGWVSLGSPALNEFYLHAMQELSAPMMGGKKLVQWEPGEQQQQDAHEFLSQLLSSLGSRLKEGEQPSLHVPACSKRLALLERELTEMMQLVKSQGPSRRETKERARQNAQNLLYEYSVLQWEASSLRMQSQALGAIFEGQRLTYISCSECGRFAASEAEPFMMEEVKLGPPPQDGGWFSNFGGLFSESPAPKESLEALLRGNAERSAPEGYKCPNSRCKSVGKSLRTMRFLRLPAMLVVHVNRAQLDQSRCGTELEFGTLLDLEALGLVAPVGRPVTRDWEPCGTKYRLLSTVFHRGKTARSGHYFAYIRFQGSWMRVNDDTVSVAKMTPMELEASEHNTGPRVVLLLYQRIDDS